MDSSSVQFQCKNDLFLVVNKGVQESLPPRQRAIGSLGNDRLPEVNVVEAPAPQFISPSAIMKAQPMHPPSTYKPMRLSSEATTPVHETTQAVRFTTNSATKTNANGESPVNKVETLPPIHYQNTIASTGVRVIVPRVDHNDFADIPTFEQSRPDETASPSPRKRKRPSTEQDIDDQGPLVDSRVTLLKTMLVSLFEAEDQIQPDTSGNISESARDNFASWSISEGRDVALASHTLTSVENALTKVMAIHHLQDLPSDHLLHLERLCAASIAAASSLELAIPDDTSSDEMDEWHHHMDIADNGMRAAKLVLQIMKGSPNHRQLHSDDLMHDLISTLRHIFDTCIFPLSERKTLSTDADWLPIGADRHTIVTGLVQRSGRVLKLLGDIILTQDVSEAAITAIESLSTKLVFIETAATEKDSFLGTQRIETLRRHAMDTTANIYQKCHDQRQYIIDEILSSLEKLPVTRQSARQYKIAGLKPIQLVSALIMQLVQTGITADKSNKEDDNVLSENEDESANESDRPAKYPKRDSNSNGSGIDAPLVQLNTSVKPLVEAAQQNAIYVTKFLVRRALNSTKSGDQPYRNLLDIFTEDFLSVLALPSWPSAELLLRALLSQLFGITENDKTSVPAKNMALDLMGLIGSAVAEMRRSMDRSVQSSAEDAIPNLRQLCEDSLGGHLPLAQLITSTSPFRLVVESLVSRARVDDSQALAAGRFLLLTWASRLTSPDVQEQHNDQVQKSASWVWKCLEDTDRIQTERIVDATTESTARILYGVILLNLPLCRAFNRILTTLLAFMNSPHANLRSRSLKSITHLLEQDPNILEQSLHVLARIIRSTNDSSPLVRDSALGLIGKCVILKPSIEEQACKCFIDRSADTATGVRRRCLKALKDAYLRETSSEIKAAAADAILARLSDIEESVASLARQMIDEIWFNPFHEIASTSKVPLHFRQKLEGHAAQIVATSNRNPGIAKIISQLFRDSMSIHGKIGQSNRSVCQAIIAILFDWIIDNDSASPNLTQKDCLVSLSIFAKSEPRLFATEQMMTLRPYIENLTSVEDLLVFRSVVVIYRCVLPVLPPMEKSFLGEVQDVLFNTVQKLQKEELAEVSVCLAIIDGVLKNTDRLVRLMVSVLNRIHGAKGKDLALKPDADRFPKYLSLAGYFGKACYFETRRDAFRAAFPAVKFKSVYELIVNTILPFASFSQPRAIREAVLDAVCLVCQSWPKGFQTPAASAAFHDAFESANPDMIRIVVQAVHSFYMTEEEKSRSDPNTAEASQKVSGAERLGNSMVLSDNDGASTALAHQFLPDIVRSALQPQADIALTATEIIASIHRQGLVHPKEIVSTLVALETSSYPLVAKIAYDEHKDMHSKHESMLDKEYQVAMDTTFDYRQKAVGNISGMTKEGRPLLGPFFEVLKTGSASSRKKFFKGICTRFEADLSRIARAETSSRHIAFASFILVNLALADYVKADELTQLIEGLEKLFANIGAPIAQRLEPIIGDAALNRSDLVNGAADLQCLADSAVVLRMIWETRTHLRQAWNIKHMKNAKSRTKDGSKQMTRSVNACDEDFIKLIEEALSSQRTPDVRFAQCNAFLTSMSEDQDARLTSDDEDVANGRLGTPSDSGTMGKSPRLSLPPSSKGNRKNRQSLSIESTPRKAPALSRKTSTKPVRKQENGGGGGDSDGGWD